MIVVHDNDLRTNYDKDKTNNWWKTSKNLLCDDKDEIDNLIMNASNGNKRPGTAEWVSRSTRNSARDYNLSILTDGVSTNQDLSKKIRSPKFSEPLW